MKFYKYQGTGNDFIIIDERFENYKLTAEKIKFLCNRNFGIGSDGLLILRNEKKYDFRMAFFNPDGTEATFCGNGARCLVAFAKHLQIIDNEAFFAAKDGEHLAYFDSDNVVLKMKNIVVIKKYNNGFFINSGTPHFVKFVEDLEAINIMSEAAKIRYHKDFQPEGTNVNFVQI